MPEYLSPGVYVEEIEIGARPIEGVSTSTAGFLGMTERGTEAATLVTGFGEYQRKFGGYTEGSYMTYAIDGFFKNGGQRCYVARIVRKAKATNDPATKANLTIENVKYTAVGKGEWGKRIAVRLENASLTDVSNGKNMDLFKLIVLYWSNKSINPDEDFKIASEEDAPKKIKGIMEKSGVTIEVFDNLSIDKGSDDYFVKKVSNLSNLIKVDWVDVNARARPKNTALPSSLFEVLNQDGAEGQPADLSKDDFIGTSKAGERTGLEALKEINEISIVYIADLRKLSGESVQNSLIDDLKTHCEELKNRFAIIDSSSSIADISNLWPPDNAVSKYAAFYYPWIRTNDPLTNSPILVPPGGFIAGIYARTDSERGVHKAPANEKINGATDVEFVITGNDQAILNPRGVNCIRSFQGRGVLVWGARTTIIDPLWKYINVRRLFIYVEESIKNGTQWVVFEPNNEKLWARLKQTIVQFLTGVWKNGALMGTVPEEAFFVKCDRTTMTQDDIDNGRLIVVIGVAPTKPAEFVIFRIAQWQGGSAATE